jgi:hypothetical protein
MSSAIPRSRSPRYPSHSLNDAIGYARKVYDGVHRSAVDSETVFRLMGFAGKSGASSTALGSIRQFGLIEGIGDRTKISDLGLKVLEPSNKSEFIEAISHAANQPSVFRAILERFSQKLPPVDEPIRAFLIREMQFSRNGVEECIAALRKTMQFISAEGAFIDEAESTVDTQDSVQGDNNLAAPLTNGISSAEPRHGLRVILPLTKDCSVELNFDGNVSQKAVENLIRHVELMKEVWAED